MTINKKELTEAIKTYCQRVKIDIHDLENSDIVSLTNEMEYQGLIDFSVYEIDNNSDYWVELRYYSLRLGKTIIINEDLDTDNDGVSYEAIAESLMALQAECDEFEDKLSITTK